MKKKKDPIIETESPQKSLEKILKTEIQVAQRISEAKERSEKMIIAAREEVVGLKEDIIHAAREERELMLAEGTKTANRKAQVELEKAQQDSVRFFETGKRFIVNASADVIQVVLGNKDGPK